MIVIGIILSFVSLGFLCWLLFALAVHALPVLVAATAGVAAYDSGAGEIGAFLVGLIAGALTLAASQIAVAAFRSPVIRTAIALVFAAPAAMAGYHAALGLAQLGVPAERGSGRLRWSARLRWARRHGRAWRFGSRPIWGRPMLPVPGLGFVRRLRPRTAEVSLSLCIRLGDRRLPIVKSDRE